MFASLGEECFMGCYLFFFFNDTATTEIYTLSLHDALPIRACTWSSTSLRRGTSRCSCWARSEEHTSELQSHVNLVCRLLLEKKKQSRPRAGPCRRRSRRTPRTRSAPPRETAVRPDRWSRSRPASQRDRRRGPSVPGCSRSRPGPGRGRAGAPIRADGLGEGTRLHATASSPPVRADAAVRDFDGVFDLGCVTI